jgi:phage protein D
MSLPVDLAGAQRVTPTFRVRVNGADLLEPARADLIEACVEESLDAPGMFTLRLVNWDMSRLRVTWVDDARFAEGSEVEIQMGYVDRLESLMVGEITGLEPDFHADEVPTLTVRGYDRRHRLLRGRRTRSFTRMKDSDIAGRIAADLGLAADVEDTRVTHDYVLQHNQTDLEFLGDRARRIGYELVVDDKRLRFRARRLSAGAALTLARDADLLELSLRLSTLGQVPRTVVRGWDPIEKVVLVAEAGPGDQTSSMGGATVGPDAVRRAFGEASAASVTRPVFSRDEADQIARGRFNEMALAYVTGEGVSIGRTDLRAGSIVRIEGIGERFSGEYYVTATSHRYMPAQGYRTGFSARRNAT